jgi:hypothetical protein
MPDFPYAQVTGKLKVFFNKIQEVGQPSEVHQKWLASIGLKSSNDRRVIPVLRFIGFIDSSNKPTSRWTQYRDKTRAPKVLAEGIREGYRQLFETYPEAHRQSDESLKAFFSTRTKGGSQVVQKTFTTFKVLCELADFESVPVESVSRPTTPAQLSEDALEIPEKPLKGFEREITININVQLTLPETTDESVYDKLFAAMKKHLLP